MNEEKKNVDPNGGRETGVVTHIKTGFHYGYIQPDEKGKEQLFVHRNNFATPITYNDFQNLVGSRVDYLIGVRPDGRMHAVDVEIVPDSK